ncbi:hypothetical protein EGH21_05365 [Halomicroarcula sp. F13]|uniref:Uncharacterized protein n=1 Tax=Haloarcula rubra TaxID=2487747 RepID=A0AAW4PNZ3_9EURY|nr:hypothetical protein [Halomicroarcula rubra]MBX0322456.1 hypothetical protein [Halomicroarcula rubra]
MNGAFRARPVAVVRDGDRVAAGALMPGGNVVVQWNRQAFPEGERTDNLTFSHYAHISDAEQATGGTVIVNPGDGPILLGEVDDESDGDGDAEGGEK